MLYHRNSESNLDKSKEAKEVTKRTEGLDKLHRRLSGLHLAPMDNVSHLAAALNKDYYRWDTDQHTWTIWTLDHKGTLNRQWFYHKASKTWYHNVVGSPLREQLVFNPETQRLLRYQYIKTASSETHQRREINLEDTFGAYLQAYGPKEKALPPPPNDTDHPVEAFNVAKITNDNFSHLAAALNDRQHYQSHPQGWWTTLTPNHMGDRNIRWTYHNNTKYWSHDISRTEKLVFKLSEKVLERYLLDQNTQQWFPTKLGTPFENYLQAYHPKEKELPPLLIEANLSMESSDATDERMRLNTSHLAKALSDETKRYPYKSWQATETNDYAGRATRQWVYFTAESKQYWLHKINDTELLMFNPETQELLRCQYNLADPNPFIKIDLGDQFESYLQPHPNNQDLHPSPEKVLLPLWSTGQGPNLFTFSMNEWQSLAQEVPLPPNHSMESSDATDEIMRLNISHLAKALSDETKRYPHESWQATETNDYAGQPTRQWVYFTAESKQHWLHKISDTELLMFNPETQELLRCQYNQELLRYYNHPDDPNPFMKIDLGDPFESYLQPHPNNKVLPSAGGIPLEPSRFEPVWQDIPPNPVQRNMRQKVVDSVKRLYKGGDRPRRAEKRRQQTNDIGASLMEKLRSPALSRYMNEHEPIRNTLTERVQALREISQMIHDDSTYHWQESSLRNRHLAKLEIQEEQTADQETRTGAYNQLKTVMIIRLGEMNRDLQTLQQVLELRERQMAAGQWRSENNFQAAMEHYHSSLSELDLMSTTRVHHNDFEESCYQIIKRSLQREDLPLHPNNLERWHPQWSNRIDHVNRQRQAFNECRYPIAKYINDQNSSFQHLDAWQKRGIAGRVASLTQEFKNDSDLAINRGRGDRQRDSERTLDELRIAFRLLYLFDISSDSDKIHDLWTRTTQYRQEGQIGKNEGQFEQKLKNCVNNAINAYTVKYDGSFLAGRDYKNNEKALEEFKEFSQRIFDVSPTQVNEKTPEM